MLVNVYQYSSRPDVTFCECLMPEGERVIVVIHDPGRDASVF